MARRRADGRRGAHGGNERHKHGPEARQEAAIRQAWPGTRQREMQGGVGAGGGSRQGADGNRSSRSGWAAKTNCRKEAQGKVRGAQP